MVKGLISAENFWKIIISSLKKWRWKNFHFEKKTFLSAKSYMLWILNPRAVWIYRFPHDPHNSSPNMTRNVQLIEHLALFWKCQNPGVVIDSCCFYDKKAAIKEIPIYYDKGMSGISIVASVTQILRGLMLLSNKAKLLIIDAHNMHTFLFICGSVMITPGVLWTMSISRANEIT